MQKVFVDANVLYQKTQRDWLYALYKAGPLFELYASEDVYSETIAHIRDNNPQLSGGQIVGIRRQLREITYEIKEYDCEGESSAFIGCDLGDLHVHAAAVSGMCDYLLTNDRKLYAQLNEQELDNLPYEVVTADDFFCLAAEASASILDKALTSQIEYWFGKSPEPPKQHELLEAADCPMFALLVQRATMRKAGLSPREIDAQLPLDERYSAELTSRPMQYLEGIAQF